MVNERLIFVGRISSIMQTYASRTSVTE